MDARAIPVALPSPARAIVLASANAAVSEFVQSATERSHVCFTIGESGVSVARSLGARMQAP